MSTYYTVSNLLHLQHNMLAEASTKDISAAVEPRNFEESKNVAQQGGNVTRQRAGIENRNKGGACIKRVSGIARTVRL